MATSMSLGHLHQRRQHHVYVHSRMPFYQELQGRPDYYKQWTEDRMSKAVKAVTVDGLSIRQASEEYAVPRSTLHDRIAGRVKTGSKSGPKKYLSTLEEEELVSFLKNCSSIGYGKTRKETIAVVQATVDKKGINCQVSESWLKSFRQRHPELTLKAGENISKDRDIGASVENLENYFDILECTLSENDLLHKPCQIFNADETGIPLDAKPLKVYGTVSQKNFYSVSTGNKKHITVLACVSAGGISLPPMIIYNRSGLGVGMDDGSIPGTLFAFSPNGWIDTELFDTWFIHHFLAYAPPVRPLLLLLDGHSSHYGPNFVTKAAEEGIIVFCFPPNTTHRTQPLDKGPFTSLKQYWKEECHYFLSKNPGKVVTQYSFGEIFGKAWSKAMTPNNIMAGFKITGIYPLDRYKLIPHTMEKNSLCERTGLQYIPFYTPRKSRQITLPPIPQQISASEQQPNETTCSSLDSDNMHDEDPPLQFTHEELVRFMAKKP